jgi:hypothetical protein
LVKGVVGSLGIKYKKIKTVMEGPKTVRRYRAYRNPKTHETFLVDDIEIREPMKEDMDALYKASPETIEMMEQLFPFFLWPEESEDEYKGEYYYNTKDIQWWIKSVNSQLAARNKLTQNKPTEDQMNISPVPRIDLEEKELCKVMIDRLDRTRKRRLGEKKSYHITFAPIKRTAEEVPAEPHPVKIYKL